MKPKQIKTLEQLIAARDAKKAVVCNDFPVWSGHKPAAFMVNLSGEILCRLMRRGMWVYDPKNKPNSLHERLLIKLRKTRTK